MWLIIRLSQTHSRATSYSAIISEWFVDVVTKVCLQDLHEMDVPPQKNRKPVCDFAL
jgi:hypothetical protein